VQAALRGIDLLLARGLAVEVAGLPEGTDPDTLVMRGGREGVEAVLARTTDVVDFAWGAAARAAPAKPGPPGAPQRDLDAAIQTGEAVLGLLARMEPDLRREKYAQKLAERLGVSEARVLAELDRRHKRGAAEAAGRTAPPERVVPGPPGAPVERKLLQFLLFHPERIDEVRLHLTPADFQDPTLGQIFGLICAGETAGRPALAQALEGHADAAVRSAAAGLLMADEKEFAEQPDQFFRGHLENIVARRQRAERARLLQEMKAAEAAGDSQTVERAKAAHPGWRRAAGAQ
jgi:DNA primase